MCMKYKAELKERYENHLNQTKCYAWKVFTEYKGKLYPAFRAQLLLKPECTPDPWALFNEVAPAYNLDLQNTYLDKYLHFVFDENRKIKGNFHAFFNKSDANSIIDNQEYWDVNPCGKLVLRQVYCEIDSIGVFDNIGTLCPAFVTKSMQLCRSE